MTPQQRAGIIQLLTDAFVRPMSLPAKEKPPRVMSRTALYVDESGLRKKRYPCTDQEPPKHLLQNGILYTLRSVIEVQDFNQD